MALTLRTDEDLDRALTELAEAEGTSKQEVIRRAVVDRHERLSRRRRLDVITNDLLIEYSDALDRLGNA
jgi:predicted transcriptional regulator